MQINDDISRAVSLMRNSSKLEEDEIYRILVAEGVERRRAARLLEFLPTVYSRLILRDSGVRFSDKFRRRLPDGTISEEQPLASESVWNEATEFALDEARRGISGEDLIAVAIRSPEFRAINDLLRQGSKLENLVSMPLGLRWPELGPEAEQEGNRGRARGVRHRRRGHRQGEAGAVDYQERRPGLRRASVQAVRRHPLR